MRTRRRDAVDSNHEAMQRIADRYVNDPEFRAEMSQDPEGTASRSGVRMNDATRQMLRTVEWGDTMLSQRVSKGFRTFC
jgi:Mrp family chromosome partitioning ATPase